MVKTKSANIPSKLQSDLKELNKIQGVCKNLYENNNEILLDYNGEFDMVGRLKIADQTRKTHIRYKNITDYESYINAIDQDYESEDAIVIGYVDKNNT